MSDLGRILAPGGDELSAYGGRWVAYAGAQIVGQGGTPQQALQAAKASRHKEAAQVMYVPTTAPLYFPPILDRIRTVLPPELPVYLVGGAVRDALRSSPIHDLDFVAPSHALVIARKVADFLGAAYFPLDESRQIGRLILDQADGQRLSLDFSIFQGADLEADLRGRDFTINAIAVDIRWPNELLDPLGGVADLQAKRLRACFSGAFANDPIRILRAIRLATAEKYHIVPETRKQIRLAVPMLVSISVERLRDELFRILSGPRPATAIRALDYLEVIPHILPELTQLMGVEQSSPHVFNAWEHTLETLKKLEDVLNVIGAPYRDEGAADLAMGLLTLRLGRYREKIITHLDSPLNRDRPLRGLLFLAALYHDVGKARTIQKDSNDRIHFYQHEKVGAEQINQRATAMRLSTLETSRLQTIVRHHLRPVWFSRIHHPLQQRAIYRFFRECDQAGVDVCLLALADFLATYGTPLPQDGWASMLEVIRTLLEAWWEKPMEIVNPPQLVNGDDLIDYLNITPGPLIGKLLAAIKEAQAMGKIIDRQQALDLARKMVINSCKR